MCESSRMVDNALCRSAIFRSEKEADSRKILEKQGGDLATGSRRSRRRNKSLRQVFCESSLIKADVWNGAHSSKRVVSFGTNICTRKKSVGTKFAWLRNQPYLIALCC